MSYRDKIHILNLVLRVVHYKTNTLVLIKWYTCTSASMLHSLLFALLVCPLSDQRKENKVNKQGKGHTALCSFKKFTILHTSALLFSGHVRAGEKIDNPVTKYILGMQCLKLCNRVHNPFHKQISRTFPGIRVIFPVL